MDQGRCVESMPGPFTPKLRVGDASKLVVHHGDKAIENLAAALGELSQKSGNVRRLARRRRDRIRGDQFCAPVGLLDQATARSGEGQRVAGRLILTHEPMGAGTAPTPIQEVTIPILKEGTMSRSLASSWSTGAMLTALAVACSSDRDVTGLDPESPRPPAQLDADSSVTTQAVVWTDRKQMREARHSLVLSEPYLGYMYAMGGIGASGQRLATVEQYDIAKNLWKARASMPEPRYGGNGAAMINGVIYVAGGSDASGRRTNTLFAYTPASNSWKKRKPLPITSGCGGSAAIAASLYVYSGCRNQFHLYNTLNDLWFTLPSPPLMHAYPAMARIGGKIYLAGGLRLGVPTTALHVYDSNTRRWTAGTPMPEYRYQAAAAAVGGKLYVVGGLGPPSHSRTTTLLIYDPTTKRWSAQSMPHAAPDLLGVVRAGSQLYLAGGRVSESIATAKVERYTP